MRKAVIYARFSPRPNADKSESNETQFDLCADYCRKHNYEVVSKHQDKVLSGKDLNRPGLWDAIESLKHGYTLIVYRLDRLARSVYNSYIVEHAVKKRGATIISISGEGTWNDTPEDKLIRNVLRSLDEYEREAIAARTKAAMLRHQANGRRMSYKTPFGWIPDPDNPALLIEDQQEQAAINLVKKLRTESKYGYRQICRELEKQGISCRGDKQKWHHATVKNILKRAGIE